MAISQTPKTINKSPDKLNQKGTNLTTVSSFSSASSCLQPSASSPSSSPLSQSMMEENFKNAELIIHTWDPNGHIYTRFISIFLENREEALVFVRCVIGLQRAMHFLLSNDSRSEKLALAQRLMQIAMKRLEKEFHIILSENREYLEPGSVSGWSSRVSRTSSDSEDEKGQLISVSDVQKLSMFAISDLRLIADTMISCGYGEECIRVYKIIRKSTIDEALYHLGIKPYGSSHISKMINSQDLDSHVKNWLNAVQITVKTLFLGEKFLCNHIFPSSETIRDTCFKNSTNVGALNLFTFPELIAMRSKRLKSEGIFLLMALYDSISNLWPEIESIFSNKSVSSVKTKALSSLHKLADSISMMLREFELSIRKDSSKITVFNGGIDPLAESVMTYLPSLANYCGALSDVVGDELQFKEQSPFPESYFDYLSSKESLPVVSVRLARIILVLLCKLDGKANLHKDVALSYLFLSNNLYFIIEKVRATNLKFILGEEWITKHEKKLKQYIISYESMSWSKVISCLPANPTDSPEKVKDCFRRLHSTFEEVYGRQTSWIVVDDNMRHKIKASITNKLMPAYEEFYGKHLVTLSEDERCMKALMRLSPENMEKFLSELFQGTPAVVRNF